METNWQFFDTLFSLFQLNYGVTGPPAKDVRFSVSVDNRSIFLPVRQHLHQYDVASGRLLRKFVGHFDRVLCSAMNEATQDLYSAGVDRNILVWTPKADEAKYEEDEEERDREEDARRRDMEAQEQDDRELQMRIVNVSPQYQPSLTNGPNVLPCCTLTFLSLLRVLFSSLYLIMRLLISVPMRMLGVMMIEENQAVHAPLG